MYNIAQNGIITMNLGDDFMAPLHLTYIDSVTGKEMLYNLTKVDTVYFSIMEPHQAFEDGVIRKIYTIKDLGKDGNILVHLTPNDTEMLRPGIYYYEAKFTTVRNGIEYVDTVVTKRKFCIL